jgi:MFS family permease
VTLRLLQGLAVGGEYCGAATYVAEHAGPGKRGYATSWIQTTSTVGLALALVIIIACRELMEPKSFSEWGWRIPFIVSAILLVFSVYIRLRLNESPLFQKMKEEGKGSKAPLTESFLHYPNNKYVLLAILGAMGGVGVVWYTSQFNALFFLTITLKFDYLPAYLLVLTALIIGTPLFVVFGWLSDRIGRLKIILAGCLLAALTYFPLFAALTHYANPDLEAFSDRNPVTVTADGSTCELHVFVTALTKFSNCDRARDLVTKLGVSFKNENVPNSADKVSLKIGSATVEGFDAGRWTAAFPDAGYPNLQHDKDGKVVPKPTDTTKVNWLMTELILVTMVIYTTMVYGPVAAFLVELFPTRIRYTSMSLPYNMNSIIGGLLPLLATAIVAATGNIYNGLWYPIGVAAMTTVIGGLLLRDTMDVDTMDIDIKVGSGVELAHHA